MQSRVVRIGGASGFWGDSSVAAPQLVRRASIDYLTFDYMAELTLSILSRAKAKDPAAGYATDFVDVAMRSVLRDVAEKGIKVLSNAGGMNPQSCADALAKLAASQNINLRIAVVEGDSVIDRVEDLRTQGVREMGSGEPIPQKPQSANAYFGALPIVAALRRGAQIVITGRCVDSALPLAALIYEFNWSEADYDRLAAGSLVGHLLECGAQATGGLFTDWEKVERWDDIGYPIAECSADGSFVITKPVGTGGTVVPACVAEQMLYEIGDPGAYILPDVVCDFTQVRMSQVGPDRVQVNGVRGRAPTDTYKVSLTHMDGWRSIATRTFIGRNAERKARRVADAIVARTRAIFRDRNIPDYRLVHLEVIGAESQYGPHSRAHEAREVVMRLVVEHEDRRALDNIFAREIAPAGTSWAPGTTNMGQGRPKAAPILKLYSFLLPKKQVPVRVTVEGVTEPVEVPTEFSVDARPAPPQSVEDDASVTAATGEMLEFPLVDLAYARSGDKGNIANIGLIARDPAYIPLLRAQVTPKKVQDYFSHLVKGPVTRFEVPGIGGFNFVLEDALGGGGMASPRLDPLAKAYGQILLDMTVAVPTEIARKIQHKK